VQGVPRGQQLFTHEPPEQTVPGPQLMQLGPHQELEFR